MYVLATAGHVDHGKSTLVRALTGMDPDRFEEEKRRGLTIDLGFAWMTLPSGKNVAFVDVPGHERFLGNMLAGVGPAPVVMLVVAADEGWQQQTTDHVAAVQALGKTSGVVVLTRCDRATAERIAATRSQVVDHLRATGLRHAPIVEVSALTGQGMDEVCAVLDTVLDQQAPPDAQARVRLWVDRSFSITGAGTVVTGTLTQGSVRRGDEVEVISSRERRPARVTVRGLQSEGTDRETVTPARRVAVNLRGVRPTDIGRGDLLVSPPESWPLSTEIDVRAVAPAGDLTTAPGQLTAHIGTVDMQVRLRPFGDTHARLSLPFALPLALGDRLVLRAPGDHEVLAGVQVVDLDPPDMRRRGDSSRHRRELEALDLSDTTAIVRRELRRTNAVRAVDIARMGVTPPTHNPEGCTTLGDWWVLTEALGRWGNQAASAVQQAQASDPLHAGVPRRELLNALDLPAKLRTDAGFMDRLLPEILHRARLTEERGRIVQAGRQRDLGPLEKPISQIEEWLQADPFQAPDAGELADLKLGPKHLAAAAQAGRILRLPGDIVLLPDAPARAREVLSALEQPFTLSQARQALDTTRRIAVPLLEHLDALRITRKVDRDSGRRVVLPEVAQS